MSFFQGLSQSNLNWDDLSFAVKFRSVQASRDLSIGLEPFLISECLEVFQPYHQTSAGSSSLDFKEDYFSSSASVQAAVVWSSI